MRTELQKVLNIKNFFKIIHLTDCIAKYSLEKPCRILLQNIHSHWLQSIHAKTHKHYPVFFDNNVQKMNGDLFGFICHSKYEYDEDRVLEHNLGDYGPIVKSELKFNLIVPEQDIMQHFVQWQRYRKYWWSSITTTPSLFGIDDIKYGEGTADVNIGAKFPWGQKTVEKVTVNSTESNPKTTSCLCCTTTLEDALFILLLDGVNNSTKEQYLRLHRKMTPFKISFALDYQASEMKQTLNDLATVLHRRLEANKISVLLPKFHHSIESQLRENLQMGVAYTAILSEGTLENGIFHLLNSSTMLKEQVHVADIDSYAALLCGK